MKKEFIKSPSGKKYFIKNATEVAFLVETTKSLHVYNKHGEIFSISIEDAQTWVSWIGECNECFKCTTDGYCPNCGCIIEKIEEVEVKVKFL